MNTMNIKLEQLKKQSVITNKEDIVASTWLSGHPSLGESDQVVWAYEIVRDEFERKRYKLQHVKSKKM